MRLPEGLAPLREPRFAWFYSARLVSTAGSSMAPIALTFAVLGLTHSATALGVVLAARFIPMVLFLLLGGVISDRFPRTLVMQTANLLSGGTQAVVAALFITGHADLWMIIVIEALNGTVSAFTMPAMEGVVPQLVQRSVLQQANALLSFSGAGLRMLGPTIAALLVVTVGAGWTLAVDSASWLLAALLIGKVSLPPRVRHQSASMLTELREGWSVFTGNTWLWVVVAGFGVMNCIHAGAWFTLGPAIALDTFGAKGWGLVLSAESCGLLLMTLVMMKVRLSRPLLSGMLGMLTFVIPLFMLGSNPQVLPLVAAAFVAGAGVEVFNIGWSVTMQENIDETVISRAYSYDALGSFVAIPVGQMLFGPLGAAFGEEPVLLTGAVVYGVTVLLVLSSRSVRDMRRVDVRTGEHASA